MYISDESPFFFENVSIVSTRDCNSFDNIKHLIWRIRCQHLLDDNHKFYYQFVVMLMFQYFELF